MVIDDRCFNCGLYNNYHELNRAEEFFKIYQCSYKFSCGMSYNPDYINFTGFEAIPGNKCLMDSKNYLIPLPNEYIFLEPYLADPDMLCTRTEWDFMASILGKRLDNPLVEQLDGVL